MSSEQFPGLQVFSALDHEKISDIMDILNENIVKRDSSTDVMFKRIQDLGFTTRQSSNIMMVFYNFYHALTNPNDMRKSIDQLEMSEDAKQLIQNTFERVRKKGNRSKVETALESRKMQMLGHGYLHHLEATAEFRPMTLDDKLQKIIVSVVVSGETHDGDFENPETINFQINFTDFKNMVEELNAQLEKITSQIKTLQEKLGDDVVEA